MLMEHNTPTFQAIVSKALQIILRGMGQVMFQNNVWSGIFFFAGIFYHSVSLGLAAFIGNILGNMMAHIGKYPLEDIKNGLYGFNGTLVGIALFYFFNIDFFSIATLLWGAALSSVIFYYLKRRFIPLTSPFVFLLWVLLALFPITPIPTDPAHIGEISPLLIPLLNSVSQIMFIENPITGILFLAGILIHSRVQFAFAIYGAFLPLMVILIFRLDTQWLISGLWGYNAVLCSMALGEKNWNSYAFATVGILLSMVLFHFMQRIGFPVLTGPFIFATWIMILIKKKYESIKKLNRLV